VSRRKRKKVAVGRINGPWGIHGHVKVTPLTSNPERFVAGATLLVEGIPRKVLDVQTPRGYPCVQFRGYEDRTAAESLAGALIEIPESELPPLPEGEYYIHDLVGLEVRDTGGRALGRLREVLRTGANDVYVIARPQAKDLLVPAIPAVVLGVDLEAGRMTIELLPGLDGADASPEG
jgi:16S rRNA processing protein RimM